MLLKKRIPFSYIIGKIKYETLLVILYVLLFEAVHHFLHAYSVVIPIAVPTIIGTVISLLLAFKSNQAYDRWWEARIIWGAIVNDSRTLIRQVIYFNKNASSPDSTFIMNFAKRQSAWCYSLGLSLRGQDASPILESLLTPEEFAFTKHQQHKPNAILMLHADELRTAALKGDIKIYQQVEIDNTLSRLCESMGKCERIKNTVFPTTYSSYIRFTLCIFILLLPFGLTDALGWLQIPVVTTISAAFLLVEKMAIHLQDPFENLPTDTPMIAISNTIERNLMEMVVEYCDDQALRKKKEDFTPVHIQPSEKYFVL